MSLPIYEAISFQGVMSGGRTNPWLVLVNKNGVEEPYVVKPFSEIENIRRESIVNEVIGNVLATEFSLNVPSPALIDIKGDFFYRTINDPNALHTYEHCDERIKFGCEYLSPNYQFINGAFNRAKMKRSIEVDLLFAFDNLILNGDRGQGKPNILMKDKTSYLIDHELAFSDIDYHTITNINNKTWNRRYEYHICYDYLKRSIRRTKEGYFVEFEEYLKHLNVNRLSQYLKQLNYYGYQTPKHNYILDYLEEVRKNSRNFVQLLQALIT